MERECGCNWMSTCEMHTSISTLSSDNDEVRAETETLREEVNELRYKVSRMESQLAALIALLGCNR